VSRYLVASVIALTVGMTASAAFAQTSTTTSSGQSTSTDSVQAAPIIAGVKPLKTLPLVPANALVSDMTAMGGKSNSTADALGGATPLSPSDLAGTSGGANTVNIGALTNQDLTATNGDNGITAGGSVNNGNVNLGSNAFGGFNGIGNFVMNTGNQNNVQGSLNVTIIMGAVP
jgi:hypothetical protein